MSQLAGENDKDYLARVERFNRVASFDGADALRMRYCFVLAINGLRDTNLLIELMTMCGLNWKKLERLLKARSMTEHAVDMIVGNFDDVFGIKKEVNVVCNIIKAAHIKLVIITKPLIVVTVIVVTSPVACVTKIFVLN